MVRPPWAQAQRNTVQVRASAGIAFSRFPDLSQLAAQEGFAFQNPGATPTLGLSAIVWVTQQLNLSFGLQYDHLTASCDSRPSEPPDPQISWDLNGITGLLGCEYLIPVQLGSLAPFIGFAAGYSVGSLSTTNYINITFYPGPTFNRTTGSTDPYVLSARTGISLPLVGANDALVSVEYWKTGTIWSVSGGQAGEIHMFLTGWKLLVSFQM